MTDPINNPKETWVFGPYELYVAGVPIRIPVTGKRPAIIDIVAGASVEWNAGAKKMEMTIDPGVGFVPSSRKIKTPTESALTANGAVEADLSGDVTLQVIVDPLSARVLSGQVATLYPLSVSADPETIGVRTFTGDAGAAAIHGQGALLAVRFPAGSVDDSPARSGALGAPSASVAVAFRNDADDGDLDGLSHETGNILVAGEIGAQLDERAKDRILRTLSLDGLPADHSTLLAYHDDTPSGPTIAYSNAIGNVAVHVVQGGFEIWAEGSPATPLFRLASDGSWSFGAAAMVGSTTFDLADFGYRATALDPWNDPGLNMTGYPYGDADLNEVASAVNLLGGETKTIGSVLAKLLDILAAKGVLDVTV